MAPSWGRYSMMVAASSVWSRPESTDGPVEPPKWCCPDWGVTPFAEGRERGQIAREIDAYNSVKKSHSELVSVQYLDITEISREADTDLSLVAEDGLHPSGAMYARWAEAALPIVLEALRSEAGEREGG